MTDIAREETLPHPAKRRRQTGLGEMAIGAALRVRFLRGRTEVMAYASALYAAMKWGEWDRKLAERAADPTDIDGIRVLSEDQRRAMYTRTGMTATMMRLSGGGTDGKEGGPC